MKSHDENQQLSSATRPAAMVCGVDLFARFPCPTGQEIARNQPLRVASYIVCYLKSTENII